MTLNYFEKKIKPIFIDKLAVQKTPINVNSVTIFQMSVIVFARKNFNRGICNLSSFEVHLLRRNGQKIDKFCTKRAEIRQANCLD